MRRLIGNVRFFPFAPTNPGDHHGPALERFRVSATDFPKLLTPGEASRLLGVTTRTVNRYVREGYLRAHRTPGGHCRFLMADLERFVSEMGDRGDNTY